MRKVIFILLLISSAGFSQSKKYIAYTDTFVLKENSYIENNDWNSFFSSVDLSEELDPMDIDMELLNAAVFFTVNKKRKKSRRVPFEYNTSLAVAAQSYATYYNSFSFRKSDWNKRKVKKAARHTVKEEGYYGSFVDCFVNNSPVLNKTMFRDFYYDKRLAKEIGDDLGLFYGQRLKAGDSIGEPEPIEKYTYQEFVDNLVKGWYRGLNRRTMKNKGYSVAACYVVLDKKSLYKTRIPNAKAIFVLGGKQTDLLPDEPMITSTE